MNFCQGKLTSSPWSELDGLQPETKIIDEQLVKINQKGFLTINSQPAVNGEKSDSPTVGKSNQLCLALDLPVTNWHWEQRFKHAYTKCYTLLQGCLDVAGSMNYKCKICCAVYVFFQIMNLAGL
jgi:hypothetical protein